jgi:hypothetical protein
LRPCHDPIPPLSQTGSLCPELGRRTGAGWYPVFSQPQGLPLAVSTVGRVEFGWGCSNVLVSPGSAHDSLNQAAASCDGQGKVPCMALDGDETACEPSYRERTIPRMPWPESQLHPLGFGPRRHGSVGRPHPGTYLSCFSASHTHTPFWDRIRHPRSVFPPCWATVPLSCLFLSLLD